MTTKDQRAAGAVMRRLKNGRNHVVVKAIKGDEVWMQQELEARARAWSDPAAGERAALKAVKAACKRLTRDACGVVCDRKDQALKGSVVVVVAVATHEEVDGVLF